MGRPAIRAYEENHKRSQRNPATNESTYCSSPVREPGCYSIHASIPVTDHNYPNLSREVEKEPWPRWHGDPGDVLAADVFVILGSTVVG